MDRLPFTLSFLALLLAASLALSCGASQGQGKLQSLVVSPATAHEQEAQFTATGFYVNPSHSVSPQSADWGACYQGEATNEVSVTAGGVAQCANGATGTFTIFAFDLSNPSCSAAINACGGGGCTIVGTAQLTCP